MFHISFDILFHNFFECSEGIFGILNRADEGTATGAIGMCPEHVGEGSFAIRTVEFID
jgi:hypothetical protein